MKVGIVGLGLIGGSISMSYREKGYNVYGYDKDKSVVEFALLNNTILGELTDDILKEIDLLIIALYPKGVVEYLHNKKSIIKKDAIVIDTAGVKESICKEGFLIGRENGFTFIGGHPMAGTQFSGIKYARSTLFKGSSFILVFESRDDIKLMNKVKEMLGPLEIGRVTISSSKEHDEIIAFTSQLAHITANAFVKSPRAREHKGFSAGSYKDMTRVAWLNPTMWSELFLLNKDNLIEEIKILEENLKKYRMALLNNSKEELEKLLREGKEIKERIDNYHR